MNFDAQALDRLGNNKDFVAFLDTIKAAREQAIAEMHNRKVEELQYLAGRIVQCDDILQGIRYDALKERWTRIAGTST